MEKQTVYRLLAGVSRTFALSIRMLREPARGCVALAYLLCRLLDTFEDDPGLGGEQKKQALDSLIVAMEGGAVPRLDAFAPDLHAPEMEVELVRETPALFRALQQLPDAIREPVLRWAAEMGRGMADFVTGKGIGTLKELELYCYFVAGTVGRMLTAIFLATHRVSDTRRQILESTAENFGKYLQFVNIIKDSGADYREGRCFLPAELIRATGLSPDAFFSGENEAAAASVYGQLLCRAADFAADAGRYVRALPRSAWHYRRFCILPLLLADKTLLMCRGLSGAIAGLTESPKIGRPAVKRSYLVSIPAALSNTVFRAVHPKRFGWADAEDKFS